MSSNTKIANYKWVFGFIIAVITMIVYALQVSVLGKLTAPSYIGTVLRILMVGAVVMIVSGYVFGFLINIVSDFFGN